MDARGVVTKVQNILGEVSGTGVQAFSEDRLLDAVNNMFNLLFTKYPWPFFRQWFRLSLDGTLGVLGAGNELSVVASFEDFLAVHRDGETRPIPLLGKTTNPYTLTGTQSQFWTSLGIADANYGDKRIQILPVTSTGYMNVLARINPGPFVWADETYLNADMLAYGAAWMRLVGDDINSNAAEANKMLMDVLYGDITASIARLPLYIQGDTTVPSRWYERP